MTATKVTVVTIDGPSGSGKGTIARAVAGHFHWHLLDSGALYRAVAVAAGEAGISLEDEQALADLAQTLDITFSEDQDATAVFINDHCIDAAIRTETAGEAASIVAKHPAVRTALLARQRGFAQPPGLVADGRDMGTVVFPHADHKFFLTASAEARAVRRHKQLNDKGIGVSLRGLSREIAERDKRDTERTVSPLQPAADAQIIDSTKLSAADVIERVLAHLIDAGLQPASTDKILAAPK